MALTDETLPRLLVGLDASGLLDHADAAVIATTLDGVILYANRYCEVLYGRAPDTLVGQPSQAFAVDPVPLEQQREIGAAILAGLSWEGDFRIRRDDGTVVDVHAIDSPLFDPDGTVTGVVSLAFDVTASRAREDRLHRQYDAAQFLADTGTLLASSLDYPQGFVRLARLCVPFLADLCLIDVAEGSMIRRRAAVHADPDRDALVQRLEEQYPPDPFGSHPAVHVIRGGAPELRAEMPEEFLRATTRDEEHLRIVQELGFESYMCVPLTARGHTLGALTLVSSGSGRRFDEEDLRFAEDVGRRAALALDNARLLAERTHVARALQANLLPPSLPVVPGIEVTARYRPAGTGHEVGGDFYDMFEVEPGRFALAIGDVSGKGPEAGAVAGLARHTLRAGALRERTPSRLLQLLHEALYRDESAGERFCTVALGLLSVRRRLTRRGPQADLVMACGGHPLPVVFHQDGTYTVVPCQGTLLGLTETVELRDHALMLSDGDTLMLYTDGVTEAHDPGKPMLGDERLIELARASLDCPLDVLADRILDAAASASSGPPRDDMALLIARVQAR